MTTVSHLGICVSDLERSLAFYTGALGFTATGEHTVGPDYGRLMEIDGVKLTSHFLTKDGVTVELLHYEHPGHTGDGTRRPLNALGLTHLSFRVDDCDEAAARIERHGGRVVDGTRTTIDLGGGLTLDFVYCTDPDGTRVELMRLPT